MIASRAGRRARGPIGSAAAGDVLECEAVVVQFEGLRALDGVALRLARDEILGLIGPNGAGKTTLVNVLSGFQRPTAGRVLVGGQDVTTEVAHKRARRGVARTFQAVRLFGDLTVLENIQAAIAVHRSGDAAAESHELARLMGLQDKTDQLASSLPYGDERRLGIARALAVRPSFLLLDEPAAGLNEAESDELVVAVRTIRDRVGCGVLVIEHDMRFVMGLSDRVQVLDYGKTIFEGTPSDVLVDPAVRAAYLGDAVHG
jgi:ABC-type branched-subunit amino acid transport system ATPase component